MNRLKKVAFAPFMLISLLIIILLIPTFWRMFQYGIFSMHDFHVFRLYEYNKCISDLVFPCRWSPDSTFEYGQPLFNFYGQLPYLFGQVFRGLGLSVIDSTKALFASSLILSALAMFLLSKQIWRNNLSALISALVYVYAPYRAVDVYVRGALPESLAFIFFPFIIYFFNNFIWHKKTKDLLLFCMSAAVLILIHNLSVVLFAPLFCLWGIYIIVREKAWKTIPQFIPAGILILGLTAFYILPVVLETKYVTLSNTTGGYYDFRNHFVTLKQLLLDRYWGYGASLWGEDDRLSLSVGQIQWILPVLGAVFLFLSSFIKALKGKDPIGVVLLRKVLAENMKYLHFYVLFMIGWVILLLTHNKSTVFWNAVRPLSYIQFPWRFLGVGVMAFALASGVWGLFFKSLLKKTIVLLIILSGLVALNTGYFFEDLWFRWNDREFFSGQNYQMQIASAASDFWPVYGPEIPNSIAPKDPAILEGSGSAELVKKGSSLVEYRIIVDSAEAEVQFPVVYFPGWIANQNLAIYPKGENGLITAKIPSGHHTTILKFADTPVRFAGNILSLFSWLAALIGLVYLLGRKHAI